MLQVRLQFERTKRYLRKIEEQRAGDLGEDDLLAFFQNCWHLKDYIANDPTVPASVRATLESDVEAVAPLMMCADLANRSKHFTLTRKDRTGARIAAYHVHAYDGSDNQATLDYEIVLNDGSRWGALQLARDAIAAWERLMATYGL